MAVVLDVLASYVQNMLTEMAKEEVHMLLGVSSEIDKMCTKLGDLKNYLADADRRNITDQSVQTWVRELKGTMYEATDIIDLCNLKSMERQPGMDAGCLNPLLFCMRNPLHAHDISSRIKNLNKRLDDIKNRGTAFNFINLGSYEDRHRMVASSHFSKRETSGELDGSCLVGENIEVDTRNLVRMLTQRRETSYGDNKILIFAIVGVGGIGKTTLAQKIFNNNIIQQEFTKKIWLSVNQEFDKIELLQRAITEAGGDHQVARNTKGVLERTLKEALNGHKTLLVMDDVWNHEAWDCVLKTPLVNILAYGSRVLVTTRDIRVARGMMAEEPYHHVKKLEAEAAWSLLKNQVVGNENNGPEINMLKDIGMGIIENCDGLPLAIKVMGGLLRQKRTRRGEWENVLNGSIWSVSQMPEEINYAIYLSYQDLHPSLKSCFLNYSLLPKRTWFVDEIVGMWISEGFVHGNSSDLEELGRQYYEELILRNLIELDKNYIDQQVCNMHDVVRSFAQYLSRNEALVAHRIESGIFAKLNSQKFIWLSLETTGSESDELEWSSLQAQISVRTLILVGHIKSKSRDLLLSFSCLRILHIQSAKFDALAESFSRLKHLRYLSITHSNISKLPESIGNMKFLQYISLFCCESLVKLPDSIGRLRQLRLLNLSGTSINHIPRGFGVLPNLRRLYGFQARMYGDWCSLEELGPLSQLTDLNIRGLDNVTCSSFASKAKLSEKVRLSYLRLSCTSRHGQDDGLVKDEEGIFEEEQQLIEEVFDELCPPPCLESLVIRSYFGRRLPKWMMSMAPVPLENLRILTMIGLPCCKELPDGLCQLPCLEFLQIEGAPLIMHVGPKFLQSYNQQHLSHLQNCSIVDLEVLESPELERICNLPKLQRLCISMCPKIKELVGLPALEGLKLEDYDMKMLPRYLQGINLRHFQIHCGISLLTSIAKGKSSPEWDKFNHIQQVKVYADDGNDRVPRKWYVSYTRDPFSFETNFISPSTFVSGHGEEQGNASSASRRVRKPLPAIRCLRRFPSEPEK